MNKIEAIAALESCLALGVFWAFWHFCWKRYTLDRFRQDIFNIRDDMFLAIAQGEAPIGFNSTEYLICRRDLNQMIRCAPTVNLVGLSAYLLSKMVLAPEFSFADFAHSRSVISQSNDPAIKAFVQSYQTRLDRSALLFLLTGSIGFIVASVPVVFLRTFTRVLLALKELLHKTFDLKALVELPKNTLKALASDLRLLQQDVVKMFLLSQISGMPLVHRR